MKSNSSMREEYGTQHEKASPPEKFLVYWRGMAMDVRGNPLALGKRSDAIPDHRTTLARPTHAH